MSRWPGRSWASLAAVGIAGAALAVVGIAARPPFPAIRDLVPAVWHDRITLAGLVLLAAVVLVVVLFVTLKATVFLLSLAFTGREALERLPDVDPLVGGTVGIVVVGSVVMGGGAALTSGIGGAGGVPYVDDAFGGGDARDAHGIVADDELQGFAATGESLPEYQDADGDRLPDSWERAGETSTGVPLPDADPNHKDLYVQVNYANGHPPLGAAERRQLRAIWADMAVSNPDGEPGIDIHVVDEPPLGGEIDDQVVVDDGISRELVETYYSPAYLGDRRCSHYMVLFGDVGGVHTGWGFTPGYLSVVDGGEQGPAAGTTVRVMTVTHELLHNVVGQLGTGDTHVRRGWLAGADGEFEPRLSAPTSRELNRSGFERSAAFETRLCDEPVGGSASGG